MCELFGINGCTILSLVRFAEIEDDVVGPGGWHLALQSHVLRDPPKNERLQGKQKKLSFDQRLAASCEGWAALA